MTEQKRVAWVLEAEVFPDSHERMRDAVLATSGEVVLWNDDWLANESWPRLLDRTVIFHGSLGNAAVIAERLTWTPGSFCDTKQFRCSEWYPRAAQWLRHKNWVLSSAEDLTAAPDDVMAPLGASEQVFVRPDSPLKPFSGRVLRRNEISLAAMDHGFYYDDKRLPVIAAPVRTISREWRYVVVSGEIVAGSAYAAEGRSALPDDHRGLPWKFAVSVAERLDAPQEIFTLDVCEAEGDLYLLELNPFSGADLYACDRVVVVSAISAFAGRRLGGPDGTT